MSVRFGQTLFGGGSVAGLVAAAGLAVCMAQAQASGVITKRAVPAAAVAKATVQAKPRRSVFGRGKLAACIAQAYGNSAATYMGRGALLARATAYGASQVEFSGYGEAIARVTFNGKPVRLAKCRTVAARAYASLEAEALVALMAQANPAVGQATAFGTTHHVGHGHANGIASIKGRASYTYGAAGEATLSAWLEGEARFQIGGAGHALGTVHVSGEPAVTKNGVRYFTTWGEALCFADAYAGTVGIHQAQTGRGVATLSGKARFQLGGKGHARAYATLWADPLAASTAGTALGSSCKADAKGGGRVQYNGKGSAIARATGYGNAQVKTTKAQPKAAAAKATVQPANSLVRNTKVYPDDAYGFAEAKGRASKLVEVFTHPIALAYVASGRGVKTRTGYGIGVGRAAVTAKPTRTHFAAGRLEAGAEAFNEEVGVGVFPVGISATAQAKAMKATRTHFAGGHAVASAHAVGMNQVNDLTRAPADRTIFVAADSRIITVEFEDRRIVV